MPLLLCILIGVGTAPFFSLQPFMAIAGGIFLLFSGLEIDLRKLAGEGHLIGKLWLGAFLPPLFAGLALPYAFPDWFSSPAGVDIHDTAFILGIALSVSAVPVVIKIMHELGWAGTLRAQRVVFTAVLCDIPAWLLSLFVLPSEGQSPWLVSHWPLLLFFAGMALVYVWPWLAAKLSSMEKLNQWVVGPLFFIGVGQALDFSLGVNLPQMVLVLGAATVSKTLGVWLMAKYASLPREEVQALAVSLNARGAMEVLMAQFALSAGIINNDFFLSLVVMALATSLMIKPTFRWAIRIG